MKNLKIEKAFNAMKQFGINREQVKPALKNLLKVFDKNWEFIEAENYRVLLDAIFEVKEHEKVDLKRKKLAVSESDPPSKKVHAEPDHDDDASSAVVSISDTTLTSLPNEKQQNLTSTFGNTRAENGGCSVIDKGKGHLSPLLTSPEKQVSERGSTSSSPKFQIDERNPVYSLNKGKSLMYCETSKHMTLDDEQNELSLVPLGSSSKMLSDLVEGSSTGNKDIKENSSGRKPRKRVCKFDIVSRYSGDVKLSFVSTHRQATYRTPDIEAVLKSVEDKFVRSHDIIGPHFSLKNILEELCESFFRMTSDNNSEFPFERNNPCRRKSPREHATLDIMGNSMIQSPHLYIEDITKGAENVKISLVDEYGNSSPPRFFYIPRNLIYQKAIVNISLARISDEDCCPNCSGDCLSAPVPCACARITNGEFAYTLNGLLKEGFLRACISEDRVVYCQDCPIERAKNEKKPDKCKGHNVKRFIKECWSKCDCSMQCGNRVVQRGITRKLQVYWTSEGKGWGLRAEEDLPMGAFVCEYVGEIVTNTELDERNNRMKGNGRHTYPVHLDADWSSESILDDDFALCLDATRYGNVARFINHRCGDANLINIPVEVETVDHHYYHIAFFTTREVKAFEELTWDYSLDFDDENHPIKAFQCHCGSALCRNTAPKGSKGKGKAFVSTQ